MPCQDRLGINGETALKAWCEAGPILDAMRDRELIGTPLPVAMDQLAATLDSAILLEPLSDTSDLLVEMQRILARPRT